MNSSLQKLSSKLSRFKISLEGAVNAAWYFVFALLVIMIIFSGLIFYQYGVGRIEPANVRGGAAEKVYFEDQLVRLAAKKIEDRKTDFKSAAAKAAGLTNPFR